MKAGVGALRIVFAPGLPARFEVAALVGEDPASLAPGETFSYGVDAGLGCFMDAQTAKLLLAKMAALPDDQNYFDDVLAAELEGRETLDHRLAAGRPENVIISSSGWGDGFYSTYWGLDAAGAPLWLVTSFDIV